MVKERDLHRSIRTLVRIQAIRQSSDRPEAAGDPAGDSNCAWDVQTVVPVFPSALTLRAEDFRRGRRDQLLNPREERSGLPVRDVCPARRAISRRSWVTICALSRVSSRRSSGAGTANAGTAVSS
jgi:hypothetical protein